MMNYSYFVCFTRFLSSFPIISIIAFILLIDTFKNQISVIFPGILKMSDSLYLVINDLKLFIKDLVR